MSPTSNRGDVCPRGTCPGVGALFGERGVCSTFTLNDHLPLLAVFFVKMDKNIVKLTVIFTKYFKDLFLHEVLSYALARYLQKTNKSSDRYMDGITKCGIMIRY